MGEYETIVQYVASEDSLIIYWEKPLVRGVEEYKFTVTVNGTEMWSGAKTWCTITGLHPETTYSLEVIGIFTSKTSKTGMTSKTNGQLPGENTETTKYQYDVLNAVTEKAKKRLVVTDATYGAVGDGKTMNTKALQQAIDDCQENERVYLPAGIYCTGALRLHSNMELYLEEGAVLQGTDCPEDYLPRIHSRFEGIEMECYSSLLNLGELDSKGGYSCSNVKIRGKGTIASGGRTLAESIIKLETENLKDYLASMGDAISDCEKPETIPARVRPRLINMSNCENIELSGLHLKDGASWNIHMIYSNQIVTFGCTIYSKDIWNGDGWDPDSSTNCTIFNCIFNTGDDSISIKSGKNPEGNLINRPTKHIRIFDCRCTMGHGLTIGSEMSGGVSDVRVWDCDMKSCLCGFEIKGTTKRGGYVNNVHVYDSSFPRILFHSVPYNNDGVAGPDQPYFSDCSFTGLELTAETINHEGNYENCDAIELTGFDKAGHELNNIHFADIVIGGYHCAEKSEESHTQNISLQYCKGICFDSIEVK